MEIRDARDDDMTQVQAIYAWHVLNGAGTFEEEPPDAAEMLRRRKAVLANALPWLVAERDGLVLGYAYAQRYHPRSAWRFTLEDSIYIAHDAQRAGAGRALLNELIARCKALGCREMIAVIGDSRNAGSIGLHRALGFRDAGMLRNVGFKFGNWRDVALMQLTL